MKKIISIVGARPQFIKHTPVQIELQKYFDARTIHTGQHYDANMSEVFFNELNIPVPEFKLDGIGTTHAEQTGNMMMEIEKICLSEKPAGVVVYGDTNSTTAGALVASKLHIPLVHIEAGLRSFNKKMPEEVNRVITDHISDLLFCPSDLAVENLSREGITENTFQCGDIMKDMLQMSLKLVRPRVEPYSFYFATIHRPYNTDNKDRLISVLNAFQRLSSKVILPLHPRTSKLLASYGVSLESFDNIKFISPVGYFDSLYYQMFSEAVITDSGGMQKEAYWLKKKCITIRSETEWMETLKGGWNELCMDDLENLQRYIDNKPGEYDVNLYGSGDAAKKIVEVIKSNI